MSHLELLASISRESSYQIVAGSFIGALCFQIYNVVSSIADEVNYVWTLSRTSILKWVFLFLRYFALAAQICHQFEDLINSKIVVRRLVCMTWFLLDVVTMELVIMAVELVLMLRVYQLYGRQAKIGKMLAACLFLEVIVMIGITAVTLPRLEFDYNCIVTVRWSTMAVFGVGVLIDHLLVLGFTLYKGYKFSQNTYKETRLLPMVVCDGIMTFMGLLSATVINVIIFAVVNKSLSIIGSPWIIAVMSTAGCKIITNIEAERDQRSQRPSDGGIELTTNVFGRTLNSIY